MRRTTALNRMKLVVCSLCMVVSMAHAQIDHHWNDSQVALESAFTTQEVPKWLRHTVAWPEIGVIARDRVEASPEAQANCLAWLKRTLKDEVLPLDIHMHLMAMKEWGEQEGKWEKQEGKDSDKIDVFMIRYTIGTMNIQIQESEGSVVIVLHQPGADVKRSDEEQMKYAVAILRKGLNPTMLPENSASIHTFKMGALLCGSCLTRDKDDESGWKADMLRYFTRGNAVVVVIRKINSGSPIYGIKSSRSHFSGTKETQTKIKNVMHKNSSKGVVRIDLPPKYGPDAVRVRRWC